MPVATDRIAEPLQALIDSRLDTIDRMLTGRVPRAERLEIVREVESQIFEMLDGRDGSGRELSREDVLAVLGRLDPPEAYLPDEEGVAAHAARTPSPRRAGAGAGTGALGVGVGGKVGGILGLVTLGCAVFSPAVLLAIFETFTGSQVVAILAIATASALLFIGGLISVILSARSRLRDTWAVVGLVTGILSILYALGLVGASFLVG